jgi:hypothetical protein
MLTSEKLAAKLTDNNVKKSLKYDDVVKTINQQHGNDNSIIDLEVKRQTIVDHLFWLSRNAQKLESARQFLEATKAVALAWEKPEGSFEEKIVKIFKLLNIKEDPECKELFKEYIIEELTDKVAELTGIQIEGIQKNLKKHKPWTRVPVGYKVINTGSTILNNGFLYTNQCALLALGKLYNKFKAQDEELQRLVMGHLHDNRGIFDNGVIWGVIANMVGAQIVIYTYMPLLTDEFSITEHGDATAPRHHIVLIGNHYQQLEPNPVK